MVIGGEEMNCMEKGVQYSWQDPGPGASSIAVNDEKKFQKEVMEQAARFSIPGKTQVRPSDNLLNAQNTVSRLMSPDTYTEDYNWKNTSFNTSDTDTGDYNSSKICKC